MHDRRILLNFGAVVVLLIPLLVEGSEKTGKGWLTSWSWPAATAAPAKMSDDQLVDMVYSRKNRAASKRADHPSLEERIFVSSEFDGGLSSDVSDDYGAGVASVYADEAPTSDDVYADDDDYGTADYGDYYARRRQGEQPSSFMTAAISPGQDQPLVTQYSHSIVHY